MKLKKILAVAAASALAVSAMAVNAFAAVESSAYSLVSVTDNGDQGIYVMRDGQLESDYSELDLTKVTGFSVTLKLDAESMEEIGWWCNGQVALNYFGTDDGDDFNPWHSFSYEFSEPGSQTFEFEQKLDDCADIQELSVAFQCNNGDATIVVEDISFNVEGGSSNNNSGSSNGGSSVVGNADVTMPSLTTAPAETTAAEVTTSAAATTKAEVSVVDDNKTEAPAATDATTTAAANNGAANDKNQPTGLAIAVIPAVIAATGAIVAKKRK